MDLSEVFGFSSSLQHGFPRGKQKQKGFEGDLRNLCVLRKRFPSGQSPYVEDLYRLYSLWHYLKISYQGRALSSKSAVPSITLILELLSDVVELESSVSLGRVLTFNSGQLDNLCNVGFITYNLILLLISNYYNIKNIIS